MNDLRPEREGDEAAIAAVIEAAFPTDGEACLVQLLRQAGRLTLSFVAECDDAIVGHIAFSPVTLDGQPCNALGLAPVAVQPSHQGRGLGSKLITQGIAACRAGGFAFVVVLGEPDYYHRFGFVTASASGLRNVYGVDEPFMVLPLDSDAMPQVGGLIEYDAAFGEL